MATPVKKSLKERLGILGVGLTANFLIVHSFDYLLYPSVIWYFGLPVGAAVMWICSFLICYGTILFYDWSKQDWIGIETLKEVRDAEEDEGLFRRLLAWALKKGDMAVMVLVSIKFDPFICTVYMRHGAHQYNGLSKRDWRIFWMSFLIGNAWWTTAVFAGVSYGDWLLSFLPADLPMSLKIAVVAVGVTCVFLTIAFAPKIIWGARAVWNAVQELRHSQSIEDRQRLFWLQIQILLVLVAVLLSILKKIVLSN